jgi:hypothetical protein
MGLRRKRSGSSFWPISRLYYGKKRTLPLHDGVDPKAYFFHKSARLSGMVRKHQTSDVQLHIGESRGSGFAFSTRPGMTVF